LKGSKYNIAIIGLGYVGLPLAVEFGKKFQTIGFDINDRRIEELKKGKDSTLEVNTENLLSSKHLSFTKNLKDIESCNFFIVTVPTPIDKNKRPDLTHLQKSSASIGSVLKKGDIVIYESTVYPGCTEEVCVPILEEKSGLIFNEDFYCGYSPERINPGDKVHTITKIKKVTSGSTPEIGKVVDDLYNTIIEAGTFLAPSIKVAEASKVIENCQRDLNISFVNELALIFERIGIDTLEVLEAAGSKWNFLPFRPGLVGGHCISVDPYYLAYKAESLGYYPDVILSGRRINDGMGANIAKRIIKLMIGKGITIKDSKALILGITFKENCPDIRNSKVVDVYEELNDFGVKVDVYDPWASSEEVKHEFNFELAEKIQGPYDSIVLAVGHHQFLKMDIKSFGHDKTVIFDVKSLLDKNLIDARL
jgi:UDP-N-acetyl-D-glucosamine/UDP-N-acetyl-D-galactosamine dehydrogenase